MASFYHRILFHDLPVLVDGPAALAAGQDDAVPPAAGLLACCFCSFEGFFGILEIVRNHGGKVRNSLANQCQSRREIWILCRNTLLSRVS